MVPELGLMVPNKEHTEGLEAMLGKLKDRFTKMELGMTHKIHYLGAEINKLFEMLLSKHDLPLKNTRVW